MNARASFQTVLIALVLGFVAGRASDGWHLPDVLPIVKTDPAPIPGNALRVLVVSETGEQGEPDPFNAVPVRQYIDQKGGEIRLWDDDMTDADLANAPSEFRNGYAKAKGAAGFKMPWVTLTNGTTGYSGPRPATPDECLALLKKYWEGT